MTFISNLKSSISAAFLLGMFFLPVYTIESWAIENLPLAKPAESDSNSAAYSDTLFGDWGGRRGAMFVVQGYDLQLLYKLDLLNNTSTSRGKIYGLDNLDIKLNVDFEKTNGSKNTSAFLHIISNRGDKPGAHSNCLPHGVDNIETPANGNTTKLFQAWLQ